MEKQDVALQELYKSRGLITEEMLSHNMSYVNIAETLELERELLKGIDGLIENHLKYCMALKKD